MCNVQEGGEHQHPPPTYEEWMAMILQWKVGCVQYEQHNWSTRRVIRHVQKEWPDKRVSGDKRQLRRALYCWLGVLARYGADSWPGPMRDMYGPRGDLFSDYFLEALQEQKAQEMVETGNGKTSPKNGICSLKNTFKIRD